MGTLASRTPKSRSSSTEVDLEVDPEVANWSCKWMRQHAFHSLLEQLGVLMAPRAPVFAMRVDVVVCACHTIAAEASLRAFPSGQWDAGCTPRSSC